MNALIKSTPEQSLRCINDRLDEIRDDGRALFEETARLFVEVHERELWRYELIPVGPDTTERRPCKNFAEWAEVRHEVGRSRAYQLKDAGLLMRSTTVDNEHQARQIKAQRQAEQRALTPTEAAERSRAAGAEATRALERMEARAWIKSIEGWAKKGRTLFRRQVGTEAAEPLIDQLEQLARDVAA